MRKLLALMILVAMGSVAQAQDDTAAQAAQQATQQAMQAAQQANAQAMAAAQAAQQANQQTMQDAGFQWGYAGIAAKPKFSVKPGTYDSPITVRMKDSTRGAVIYYSTDGWTPTADSPRYKGPITISTTTRLNAIAIAPYGYRSLVATAQYTLKLAQAAPPAATPAPQNPLIAPPAIPAVAPGAAAATPATLTLEQGTEVPLEFASEVNSRTAEVGDKIEMTLTEDLKVGDVVVAKKGSTAAGIVIQADKNGAGGAPGSVTFEVDSLNANGQEIKLYGTATREGQAKPPNASVLIPGVGPFLGLASALRHGKDAVIEKGTPFVAYVSGDTPVTPAE